MLQHLGKLPIKGLGHTQKKQIVSFLHIIREVKEEDIKPNFWMSKKNFERGWHLTEA